MSIPKFTMPKDLSELPAPVPFESLDENFDAIAAYLGDVVRSELEGLHKLVAELTAKLAALEAQVIP